LVVAIFELGCMAGAQGTGSLRWCCICTRHEVLEVKNSVDNENSESRIALRTVFSKAFLHLITLFVVNITPFISEYGEQVLYLT
jgi:hypothetical protein